MSDSQTKILKSFLNRTSFYSWKGTVNDNYHQLEIIINDDCDQNCLYCYERKFGKYYFTEESKKHDNILKNLRSLMVWLKENQYYPELDLFSAEIFSQELGFEILDVLLNEINEKFKLLVVPSNMNFLFDDEKTKKVEKYKEAFENKGVSFVISASVDGAFMEENRPIISGLKRDEIFYDKLFKFAKKHNIGFHPMIYSNRIEHWKDNFLWFQKNFERYDIPFTNIYLLEVRNAEWKKNQVKEFSKFLHFLIQWLYKRVDNDPEKMINAVLNKGFNILASPFVTVGRGLACSIQSTVCVRIGDLNIMPCHRTSYKQFSGGEFIKENDKIVDIKGNNAQLYTFIKSIDTNTQPYCESCYVKYLCQKGCLGAQFEITGDLFVPIPTVCRLEHVKIITILDELQKIGCLGYIIDNIGDNKKNSIYLLKEENLL